MKLTVSLAVLGASTFVSAIDPAITNATLPASCTFKPTQTITATAGCPTNCATIDHGFADAALVVPCGCTEAALEPTTTTVCPTTTACVQFQTGWGIAVITESNCAPTATPF